MKRHDDIFDELAHELCSRVGLTYPPPKGGQYAVDAASWTESEESDFEKWMGEYLTKIPRYKRLGKKWIQKEIQWFMFQYGWITKGAAR